MQPKFIFVIGGVLSGIGKGITTASLALLIKARGFKTTAIKIDPYISIDAGTMRPAEHGEVFVTDDGGEIDQDLGNYERFLNQSLTKDHNITTGKVFANVIHNERHFKYQGRDAQMFPDVINEIKRMILYPIRNEEIVLVEVGGTTGDLENKPFLHAVRQLGREYDSIYILITYLPFLKNIGELKTKPTQHAVSSLRETGIFPDFIITRSEIAIDNPRIETISSRCFIEKENIIDNHDTDNIYQVPLTLQKSQITKKILDHFSLKAKNKDLKDLLAWKNYVKNSKIKTKPLNIALVGKYVKHGSGVHKDVYLSVNEALNHAAASLKAKVNIIALDSSIIEKKGETILKTQDIHAIVIPQGWGKRGVEGKILAAKYARENKIPYLGLCFGMQLATVEFARNVLGYKAANSEEVDNHTKYPIIHIMPEQKKYLQKKQYGGTIRLGAWPCKLKENTIIHKLYLKWKSGENNMNNNQIFERHRHRYEVNNLYVGELKKNGYIVSGRSPDGKLVETMEIDKKLHPFFLGTQFHPEYKSRPLSPHPVFLGLLEAAIKFNKSN